MDPQQIALVKASALPLGAVAPLLGTAGLAGDAATMLVDPVRLFDEAVHAIAQRADGRRLVTVVDDIHLLDDASLTLLSHLLARSAIFLIGTVRTGEPVPDLLTGLWRDDRVTRIDLDSLSREHVDTLLHLVLGAPMEVISAKRVEHHPSKDFDRLPSRRVVSSRPREWANRASDRLGLGTEVNHHRVGERSHDDNDHEASKFSLVSLSISVFNCLTPSVGWSHVHRRSRRCCTCRARVGCGA